MAWIDINEKLPPVNLWVYVCGQMAPQDWPAVSRLRSTDDPARKLWGPWESEQTRGEVGITHWWDGPDVPTNKFQQPN